MKDHLKARGYRGSDGSDGRLKSWWIKVDEDLLDAERHYLRAEIYRYPDADPPIKRLTQSIASGLDLHTFRAEFLEPVHQTHGWGEGLSLF